MDFLRLAHDYNVPFVTEGHKHARKGWVNTSCPFCSSSKGHTGYHLGWNVDNHYFYCWRCGWHSPVQTISKLTGRSINETYQIVQQYGVRYYQKQERPSKHRFLEPSFMESLTDDHKRYLKSRNFNPKKLEKTWGLKSTKPISKVDNIRYPNRIYIPYKWNGETVSFDTRTPRNKGTDEIRYLACPKNREAIPHKDILYGNQEAWTDRIVIVEGTTDVWRIGQSKAAATSGIQYTDKQVHLIGTTFKNKKVAIWFDEEPQAQKQAKKLMILLQSTYNIDSFLIKTKGDPASLDKATVKRILKNL